MFEFDIDGMVCVVICQMLFVCMDVIDIYVLCDIVYGWLMMFCVVLFVVLFGDMLLLVDGVFEMCVVDGFVV